MSDRRTRGVGDTSCKRCGKGHPTRECKTKWLEAWPGRPATRFSLRTAENQTITIESPLSPENYEKALALLNGIVSDKDF